MEDLYLTGIIFNIYSYRHPWFYKTIPFLSFQGNKQGQTHLFFSGIAHYLRCVKNSQKSLKSHIFEFQLNYFSIKSKVFL